MGVLFSNVVVPVYQDAGGGTVLMETQARGPKIGFEQNFQNCKTTQKQVKGTKWHSVGTGFSAVKWCRVGLSPLYKFRGGEEWDRS